MLQDLPREVQCQGKSTTTSGHSRPMLLQKENAQNEPSDGLVYCYSFWAESVQYGLELEICHRYHLMGPFQPG